MFISIIGSSGVGKNTIIEGLIAQTNNISYMPTITTRKSREGERSGYPYYFVSKKDFIKLINEERLFEYELIHDNYYGVSKDIFNDLNKKSKILIKDIGVDGASNIKGLLSKYTPVINIFIASRSKLQLKKRLKNRGEKQIKKRLKRYKYEQSKKYSYDYHMKNISLTTAENNILDIISVNDDYSKFIFTKPFSDKFLRKAKRISEDKIYKVKVSFIDGNMIILNNPEVIIKSINNNIKFCRVIVDIKNKKKIKGVFQEDWAKYIENQLNA